MLSMLIQLWLGILTTGADEAADLVSKAWAEHATHTYDGVGTPGMIGRPTPTYTPPVGLKKKIRRSTHKSALTCAQF